MKPLPSLLGLLALVAGIASAAVPPAPAVRLDALGDPLPKDAVARLGSSRFRCAALDPSDLALSADGKIAAVLDTDGGRPRVALIDPATGLTTRFFDAEDAV